MSASSSPQPSKSPWYAISLDKNRFENWTALLAGAALLAMVSPNRRSIGSRFPRHPHYLAVAVFPEVRQFPISRLKRRRPRRQHPRGPSSEQGQTAVRGRPIGGPFGLARIVSDTGEMHQRGIE